MTKKTLGLFLAGAIFFTITACSNYANYGERGARTTYNSTNARRNISQPVRTRPLPLQPVRSQPEPGIASEPVTHYNSETHHSSAQNPPTRSMPRADITPGYRTITPCDPMVPPNMPAQVQQRSQSASRTHISQDAPYTATSPTLPDTPNRAATSRPAGSNLSPTPQRESTHNSPDSANITHGTQHVSAKRELASHKTEFNAKEKNRVTNITRASSSINGHVVKPGETFSYNETVGPTNERRGYKEGTIFVQGEKKKGFGGGVCQVSTTLCIAADEAGMTIIERHDHSRPVTYAKEGEEAATSYGGIDFKFKNEKSYPIVIKSSVEGGTVSVSINEA